MNKRYVDTASAPFEAVDVGRGTADFSGDKKSPRRLARRGRSKLANAPEVSSQRRRLSLRGSAKRKGLAAASLRPLAMATAAQAISRGCLARRQLPWRIC